MSKTKIELNHSGIKTFLHSKAVAEDLKSRADRIADKLGNGYKSDFRHMGSRVIASVYADSNSARRQNMRENSIMKAVLESADR